MSKSPVGLQVDEIGERFRYRVHSEARPQNVYLVDLLANKGRGECSCKDWICRCWPRIKQRQRSACKHVTAARDHFVNALFEFMATREERARPASTVHQRSR